MVDNYQSIKQASLAIDGMTSAFSMAVMDSLSAFQKEQGGAGHIVELGAYKGRSAAALGGRMQPGERLILVDVVNKIDPNLPKLCPQMEFVECGSEEFERK